MTLEQYLPLNVASVFGLLDKGELTARQALEWERANEKRKSVLERLEDMAAQASSAAASSATQAVDADLIKVKVSSKLPENMVFTHPRTFVTVTSKGAGLPDDAWTQKKIGTNELELVR
jgi:hypothetical protein